MYIYEFLAWAALADSKLTDYSHADYIPILDGTAIIWNETIYIRHISNLTEYGQYIQETTELINAFSQSNLRKILEVDTTHLQPLLETLGVHHRHSRSLNFLGSALKVIAGTPDFDDLMQIRLTEQELIQSNNRQIGINSKTQEQINALIDKVNQIL